MLLLPQQIFIDYPLYIKPVQEKETANPPAFTDLAALPTKGRVLALDPGTKRIGLAVTDETQTLARPLPQIERRSWKKVLADIRDIAQEFDAVCLVIGLPLNTDGSESEMSEYARRMARNFELSLEIPVVLEDERVTSYEARGRLWQRKGAPADLRGEVDSEAAVIILEDLLSRRNIII